RQLNKTGTFFTVAAPGTDGIRTTRLRGQGPCAVPEGRRTHQPQPATAAAPPLRSWPTSAIQHTITAHMTRRLETNHLLLAALISLSPPAHSSSNPILS